MKRTPYFVLLCLLFSYTQVLSQEGSENTFNTYFENPIHNSNIIPSTPNASNFTIYGNTPVNTSSGLPSISIPLFTFDVDGVQVPISLSYHASGIKVDDLASTVGMKWTLNAGGGIFRTIKDVDDFGEDINGSQGWIRNTPTNKLEEWISSHSTYNFASQYAQNSFRETVLDYHDEWPDDFSYNFLGNSGEFVFKTNGEIFKAQKDRISIQGGSTGFIAEDQNGNIFHFYEKEKSSKFTYHFTENDNTFNVNRTEETTGWMLSEIFTKNGKSISFGYESSQFQNELIRPSQQLVTGPGCDIESCYFPFGCISNNNSSYINHVLKSTNSIINSTNQLIKTIFSDDVEVVFNYSTGSVGGTVVSGWDKRLTEIIIFDKLQNKQKRFLLNYETYSGDSRLKLKEIIEIGFDNNIKPPYVFNYNSGNLPPYNSFSKDLKGFYNGKSNSSLLPKTAFSLNMAYAAGPNNEKSFAGYEILADRYFDIDYLKRGALEEIIYPTGGKTKYTYEENAHGENLAENLLNENEINLSNQGYYHYTDSPYEVYSVLVDLKDVTGRFKIESYADCPDCDDPMGNINIPILRVYEYSGNLSQPINQSLIGNEVLKGSLHEINSNNQYLSFLSSNYSNNDLNGTYIFQLKIHIDAYIDYPNLFVNLGFKWHNKKRDQFNQLVYQKHYFGGLRIKEIKDIDVNDSVYNHKIFTYLDGVMGDEFDSNRYSKSGLNGPTGQDIFSSDIILEHGTTPSNGYTYTKVKIESEGANNNGYTYEYYEPNYAFYNIKGGDLVKKEVYDSNYNLVLIEEINYEVPNSSNNSIDYSFKIPSQFESSYSDGCREHGGYNWSMPMYHYYSYWKVLSDKKTTQFLKTGGSNYQPVTTINEFDYNDDLLVTYEKTDSRHTREDDGNGNISYPETHPNGEYVEVEFTYKSDYPGEQTLAGLPMALPISKEVKNKGQKIQGQYFVYDQYGNIKTTYHYNKGQGSNTSPLSYIPSNYEEMSSFLFQNGKPVQVKSKDGVPTSYIYGYNHQYPVAKIENKAYSTIPSGLISAIHTASSGTGSEAQLQTALDNLRNDTSMANTMITTYTYSPLVGVTTITGPNGDRIRYYYDEFGRLDHIRDKNGNLIEEYEYNYGNN